MCMSMRPEVLGRCTICSYKHAPKGQACDLEALMIYTSRPYVRRFDQMRNIVIKAAGRGEIRCNSVHQYAVKATSTATVYEQ